MTRAMRRSSWISAALVATAAVAGAQSQAQRPQPPPPVRPGGVAPAAPAPAQAPATEPRPSEAELGVPLYPTAVYLKSYDAGRGQRYHVFGVPVPFAEMVTYYRNVLKTKGDIVFEVPPTHVFEIGRFREETMAFPPTVTVKDYTFSGTGGYPNPRPGAQPERFPTLIQIVPAPPATQK